MADRFKKFLQKVLPPFLADIIKKINRQRIKYYGLERLDFKIERYLNYDRGYYVELGANDGITQSNTAYFEKFRDWKGILIEPTPHNYLRCLKNRSSANRIYCNACVSFDYPDKFVELEFSNLMSTPLNLESDIPNGIEHAKSGIKYLDEGEKTFTFGALAATLNSLLVTSNAPNVIDLLSLDVEGAEIEVLKGIDHSKFRFKYICIECRDEGKMKSYMKNIGYEYVEKLSVRDFLFRDINFKQ